MKLKTFFEKFDQFADAPNAVAKMRELVLQLAVQGKLLDQNPSDETADKLLAQIRKTKDRLISDKAIKKQDTDPITNDQAPFVVPPSWAWTRLGEVGDWGSGSTPPRGNHELYGGNIPWLKSGELNDNQSLSGSEESVTELALKTGSFRRNIPGDVLLAMYGATIGKVAILAEPAVTNQAVCGCTPFKGVINRYLITYLISQRANFHSASEGGAQPNISKIKIVGFPFPLPPLAEQKRIVAKVDELMALCDRLDAQQQERATRHADLARASLARFAAAPTPANLHFLFHKSYTITPADLRKSILTLAVQGKLVPQDPNDEPANRLIDRILKLRQKFAQGQRAKVVKRLRILDSTSFDHNIPDLWTWCRLGELVLDFRYGTSRKCARNASGVPVLRIPNIQSGRIDSTDLKFTDMPPSEFNELRLQKGDVLLVRSNGSESLVGRSAVASVEDERFAYAGYLVRARIPQKEIFSPYLHLALSTPSVRNQIESPIRTTSGVKNINTTELSNLVLSLPPLAEQRRIVVKVDQLMALVDELETQIAASRATANNLLEALVAELTTP
ncbi:MAG: restriction endonuclease subunit S [Verrucomicrobiota bacterium]